MKINRHIVFLIIIMPIFCFSQEHNRSYIYNYKGQLRLDTTLSIGHEQYRTWCNIEGNILHLISRNIDYPGFAKESNLTGTILVSFECDTLEIRNIRLIKSCNEVLEKATIDGINKIKGKLNFEFRHIWKSHHGQRYKYIGTYYLPVEFDLMDLREEMKRKYTMPVIATKSLHISRWIE